MFKFLLGLLLLHSVPAFAEIAGRIRLQDDFLVREQFAPVDRNELSGTFELEWKRALSDDWRLRFEPHVRFSSADSIVWSPIRGAFADSDLRDTQLQGRWRAFNFQIGSFIKVWEGTDGLNPMDIATMKSLRDPILSENLGSIGVAGSVGGETISFDALYVPWQTPTRLPGESSPWWPRSTILPVENERSIFYLPERPEYILLDRKDDDQAKNHNYGGRVQVHGKKWDASAAYFEGAAQIPFLQPDVNATVIATSPQFIAQISNPIGIRPIDYRRRTAAGAFVYTLDSWIFRAATRYDHTLTDNAVLTGWSDQTVLGVEKNLTVWSQNLVLILQYAFGGREDTNGVASSQELFRRTILYGIRWPFGDGLVISFTGFYADVSSSNYNRIHVKQKLNGASSLELSGDRFEGPSQSLLGIWSHENRASLAYIYQF